MVRHRSKAVADRQLPPQFIPWRWLEKRTASAFALGGALLTASLLVPVGLTALSEWAWASGILLVGLGVMAVVGGLLGLYPRAKAESPGLATVGVLSTAIAGLAALGLLAMGGIALVGVGLMGVELGTPMGLFSIVALSMAGGFAAGFLAFGIQAWRSRRPPRAAGLFLLLGGGLLLVPIVGELARRGVGIGPPAWLLLPVLAAVSMDTLAVGLSFRQVTEPDESSSE